MQRNAGRRERHYGRPRKYIPTKRADRIIKAAYLELRRHGDYSALKRAAEDLNWPRYAVSRRAAELGVSRRIGERPWSKLELMILGKTVELGAETIRQRLNARGFKRPIGSILAKKKSIQAETSGSLHSARQAALGLGVDPHKVSEWIRRRLLAAKRGGQKNSRWFISTAALRDFVFQHSEHIDLAQANKTWLLEVLRGPS
jgi:hypothetical protein